MIKSTALGLKISLMNASIKEITKAGSHKARAPIPGVTDKPMKDNGERDKDMGQERGLQQMGTSTRANGAKESQTDKDAPQLMEMSTKVNLGSL